MLSDVHLRKIILWSACINILSTFVECLSSVHVEEYILFFFLTAL